ncbi:MAG: hypothetical protein AAGL68_00580 [Pseudomonadota bacterium]
MASFAEMGFVSWGADGATGMGTSETGCSRSWSEPLSFSSCEAFGEYESSKAASKFSNTSPAKSSAADVGAAFARRIAQNATKAAHNIARDAQNSLGATRMLPPMHLSRLLPD